MPNSFDHCDNTCPFDELEYADYVGLEEEMAAVRVGLCELTWTEEDQTADLAPNRLAAKQRLAARGCAAAIFAGNCQKFEWRTTNGTDDWLLAVREREQN